MIKRGQSKQSKQEQCLKFKTYHNPTAPGNAMLELYDSKTKHGVKVIFSREEWDSLDKAMRVSFGRTIN